MTDGTVSSPTSPTVLTYPTALSHSTVLSSPTALSQPTGLSSTASPAHAAFGSSPPPVAPGGPSPRAVATLAHPTGVPGATLGGMDRRRAGADGPGAGGPSTRAVTVGVVGACGGVGASTLAAAVAVTGAREGLLAVLVDGRHAGAGIDVLLGIEEEPGLRWADLQDARGEVDPVRLLDLLPRWSGVHVLSTDRARSLAHPDEVEGDVLRAVVSAADLVVLDLPQGRVADRARSCDVGLVVALCETLSAAGAQSVAAELGLVPSGLVCRRSAAGRLLPHDVAAAAGMELWGELVTDPRVATAVEAGAGPPVRTGRDPAGRGRGWAGGRRARGGGRGREDRGAARSSLGGVARAVLSHAQAVAGSGQAGR